MALYQDSLKPKTVQGRDLGKVTERTPSIPTPSYKIAWGREPHKECNKKAWARETTLWRDGNYKQFDRELKYDAQRWYNKLHIDAQQKLARREGVKWHKVETKHIIPYYLDQLERCK